MNDINDMDEFDQDPSENPSGPGGKSKKANIVDAVRNKPLFKLMAIMIVVALAIAGALGAFSGAPTPDVSKMAKAPEMHEPPGGQVSPFFAEQNKMANDQRVKDALQQGQSAMPTPIGQNADISEAMNPKNDDPLKEFRAETDKLRQELQQEQQRNNQQVQQAIQQAQQRPEAPPDDSLAQAMQKQMRELMESWQARGVKVVAGAADKDDKLPQGGGFTNASATAGGGDATSSVRSRGAMLVSAGTVNYAQLLTEANSDVQSPILAQILSGPLAGGRAIGTFSIENDYLVMKFTIVNLKGKDYPVNILALNPDTTLSGMATEVDHRYIERVLLPAAASFVSAFGSTLGQGGTTTTSTTNGIIVDQAKQGYKDALYAGVGSAGQTMSQFFSNEANQTKTLVRVAVGTPMGMFFLTSVYENAGQETDQDATTPYGAIANYMNNAGRSQQQVSMPYAMTGQGYSSQTPQTGTRSGYYPYGSQPAVNAPYGYAR